MFDPKNLSEQQKQFIRENAMALWEATVCPPNDDVEALLVAKCSCCRDRRDFVKKVIDLSHPTP